MATPETEAFVTLATNDTYGIGCLTLARSLRRARTSRKLAVMITSGVTQPMRNQLQQVFDVVETVNLLDSQDPMNLQLMGRPDLNVTFTKLHCWCLTQFTKCVFLDADTLVLQNVDELFDREELSAAPDAGWPDCFNSGVFVFRPSLDTYQSLLDFAISQRSFDGADQGLLNSYFSDWATRDISKHLPFIYNVVSQAFYSYLPAFTKFKDSVKIVHFIGPVKPWSHTYNTVTRTVTPLPGTGHSQEFLQIWWTIFVEDVQGSLDPQLNPHLNYAAPSLLPSCHTGQNQSANTSGTASSRSHTPERESYFVVYPFAPPTLEHVFYTPSVAPSANFSVRSSSHPRPQSPHHPPPPSSTDNVGHSNSAPPAAQATAHVVSNNNNDDDVTRSDQNRNEPDTSGAGDGNICDQLRPKVIEMRETESRRPYLHLETHYSEDPLSSITPESPTPVEFSAEEFGRLTELQSNPAVSGKANKNAQNLSTQDSLRKTAGHIMDVDNHSRDALLSSQPENVAVLTGGLDTLQIGDVGGGPVVELEDWQRKLAWEKGQIDYLGRDSFANIQKKLDATIHSGASEPVVQASQAPFPRVSPTSDPVSPTSPTAKSVTSISISSKPPQVAVQPQSKTVKTSIKLGSKAKPK